MDPQLASAAAALAGERCPNPFDVLGLHPITSPDAPGRVVRVFIPWARSVSVVRGRRKPVPMDRRTGEGLFELAFPEEEGFFRYRLEVEDPDGNRWTVEDPYRFPPALDEDRARAFVEGRDLRVHEFLGAHVVRHERVMGTRFAVWAPHARAVSVAGTMNHWDGRCHPMRARGSTGVWELFIPGVQSGALYKFHIVTARGSLTEKADPCGRAAELRPATASVVWHDEHRWEDRSWMKARARWTPDAAPMSVYEVHLGSWRRGDRSGDEPGWLSYRELADELVPYARELGFTHLEILPVQEHPLDQSWGYQALGFFAPTSRFGTPDDFRYFVDRAHREGLGVILDWVPGHFPEDAHGLARFDGTPLYEHPHPSQARHPDWGTLTFNYASPAVRAFLISSALYWLEEFHLDGLRVDAVASMLYLDYSRPPGDWIPNRYGGNENLDAVDFLRQLNDTVHEQVPGALMIAEESTAWPRVSGSTQEGGLGFDQKWNMGWMNDTLHAMSTDPLYRKWKYDRFTFSLVYAFAERFVLPLSHDEVVHGKRSLAGKMPGPDPQKLANLRTLLAHQWTHPGKKLLFMGGEFGQWTEWNVDHQLDWALAEDPAHDGIRGLVRDLNRLYRDREELHALDHHGDGFEWVDCSDGDRVILSFLRWSPERRDFLLVVVNLTPVHRPEFRAGVPRPGGYRVLLNSDAPVYGGDGMVVPGELTTEAEPLHGHAQSMNIPLPGLSVLILAPED